MIMNKRPSFHLTSLKSLKRSAALLALVGAIGMAGGCKEDSTSPDTGNNNNGKTDTTAFTVQLYPTFNGDALHLYEKHVTSSGDTVSFSNIKFYLSDFRLVSDSGKETSLDGIFLVNLDDTAYRKSTFIPFNFMAPTGNYTALKFNVGIDSAINHRDASADEFPLGPNSGMYWSWNPGYVFHKVEGTVDSAGKEITILYHLGEDKRNAAITITDAISVSTGKTNTVSVNADYNKFFSAGLKQGEPLRPSVNKNEREHQLSPKNLADRIYANTLTMSSKK